MRKAHALPTDGVEGFEALKKLTRDVRAAAKTLSDAEVRFLVDYYYALQEDRIRSDHQVRTLTEGGEPCEVITWLSANVGTLERNVKSALGAYADADPVGRWSQSIVGIGPILAAGLLAHIDITQAPTVGHIWSFAGLNPTVKWEKKTKRPWNARLKTLCWKIGESFVKVSGHERDIYGHLYLERKAYEQARNERGELAAEAARALAEKRYRDDTKAKAAYLAGQLPAGHLHARAKRWAVKLFLAHWHDVAYTVKYGQPPPRPYVLTEAGGHAHRIDVPNWPLP
jgi:Transposase IS116/IS110/IS902 family